MKSQKAADKNYEGTEEDEQTTKTKERSWGTSGTLMSQAWKNIEGFL